MSLEFTVSFAGVHFLIDESPIARMAMEAPEQREANQLNPRKSQPLADLIDEVNRLIKLEYIVDFQLPSPHPGRNLGAIARHSETRTHPGENPTIGEFYYPTTASRWSVFRGLATSSQIKKMLATTQCKNPASFILKVNPIVPNRPHDSPEPYTITTSMYLLPPRPLAETGGTMDGLFLVTLVDERYYFQGTPVTLRPTKFTTWNSLLETIATALNVTITPPTVSPNFHIPEADSQFWSNAENAATLLDAVAFNIGCTVVRNYDGTYKLLTPTESQTLVSINRGNADRVVRTAGGDIFNSGTQKLPSGDLLKARNAVIPKSIWVAFPKYITGDPVPHFLNSRYQTQRPTSWYEESYGDTHLVNCPIASGGAFVSGLIGVGSKFLRSTAKALYSGEIEAASGLLPANNEGLHLLAMQMGQTYYGNQVAAALDESYPGTFRWQLEGIHDIIWTVSCRTRQAITRVIHAEWTQEVIEYQQSSTSGTDILVDLRAPNVPYGVGGPSVAQTWIDSSTSGTVTELRDTLLSGNIISVPFLKVDHFPTNYRWVGKIEDPGHPELREDILFEGTSGLRDVSIVYRGWNGTAQRQHIIESEITQLTPNTTFGVNLVRSDKGEFTFPGIASSGGIAEAIRVPQTQTVYAFSSSGKAIKGVNHFSGKVLYYETSLNQPFTSGSFCWLVERNSGLIESGKKYDGQFVGFSASGDVAPVYLINQEPKLNVYDTVTGVRYSGINTLTFSGFHLVSGTDREVVVMYSGSSGINNLTVRQSGGVLHSGISLITFLRTHVTSGAASGEVVVDPNLVTIRQSGGPYFSGVSLVTFLRTSVTSGVTSSGEVVINPQLVTLRTSGGVYFSGATLVTFGSGFYLSSGTTSSGEVFVEYSGAQANSLTVRNISGFAPIISGVQTITTVNVLLESGPGLNEVYFTPRINFRVNSGTPINTEPGLNLASSGGIGITKSVVNTNTQSGMVTYFITNTSGTGSVALGARATITFDTDVGNEAFYYQSGTTVYDISGFIQDAAHPDNPTSCLQAPSSGLFHVGAFIEWGYEPTNSSGKRYLEIIQLSGSQEGNITVAKVLDQGIGGSTPTLAQVLGTDVLLGAGDKIAILATSENLSQLITNNGAYWIHKIH